MVLGNFVGIGQIFVCIALFLEDRQDFRWFQRLARFVVAQGLVMDFLFIKCLFDGFDVLFQEIAYIVELFIRNVFGMNAEDFQLFDKCVEREIVFQIGLHGAY